MAASTQVQVGISQTISAPSGDHVPGSTHIAALLLFGTLGSENGLSQEVPLLVIKERL